METSYKIVRYRVKVKRGRVVDWNIVGNMEREQFWEIEESRLKKRVRSQAIERTNESLAIKQNHKSKSSQRNEYYVKSGSKG